MSAAVGMMTDTIRHMEDVLVVGEALIDIVAHAGQPRRELPGGSPANVALGLGRLGRQVRLLTRIGADAYGEQLTSWLADSGVQVVPGSRTKVLTSTAFAKVDTNGNATYTFDFDWRLPSDTVTRAELDRVRALHTGSLAAFLPPGGDSVMDLIRTADSRVTVSYDPNVRPALMGEPEQASARVDRIIPHCDVVKASVDDLAWLTPAEDPQAVAQRWLDTGGPSIVIVTRAERGAFALTAAGMVEVDAPRVTVADTMGAGDAFTAGMLDYLAQHDLLGAEQHSELRAIAAVQTTDMLQHAVAVAAACCSRHGADPPTRDELATNL